MNKLSLAIKLAIPFVVLSLNTQIAQAADDVELTESGLELTVTANRRPEDANKTLAAVTVISKEDIQETQATNLVEVLTRVPGLNISNSGGAGKATSIYIRGTNSGHVLVLIDGVRHGSATLGSTSFQHIPVEQIDRIEVVRGPRSSLYGSDAIGGVIQIFTRKAYKGFTPSIEVSAGSNDTFQGNVNLAGGNGKTWFNLNVQSEETKGINAFLGTYKDYSTSPASDVFEPDLDGYSRKSFSLNLGHAINDKVKSQVSVLRSEGETEFDGGYTNETDFVQQAINTKIIADVSESLNLSFSIGQSRDESDNFKDGEFRNSYNTKRDIASVVADYSINDNNNLLFGTDWYDDKISSTDDYDITSRDNKGVFGSYSSQLNNTQFDVSLRNDHNEQFGSKTTGGFAVGQKINDALRIKGSYGTAFKAPSFNQLYYPYDFGNPDLNPESSKNYEFGFDGNFANINWEVNAFQNDIDNLIVTTADFSTSENTDKARIRGLEASFSTVISNVNFSTNITLQKPENLTGADSGKLLRNRPEKILNIDIGRKFGSLTIGSTLHAESKRYTDTANTESLGGFARLDLRAEYDVSKNWTVGLKVENALDKEYSLNNEYNQDGASGLLTVKYSPK